MHPSPSSNNSVSVDTHLSKSFTRVDNRIHQSPRHVSLSQPCLPVSNLGPTKILPYLFLGSQSDAHCEETMALNGITYVLNVSVCSPRPVFIQDGHFLRIPVSDGYTDKLSPFFNEAFQFLDKVREANGCVLIHCLAGVSRSPTLAIAYIMHLLNMTMDEAYRYVKDKRPTISPNFNFLGQLLEYEKQLTAKKSDITDGRLEASFSNQQHPGYWPAMTLRKTDCCREMTLNFAPTQKGGHALTLVSPTTALSRLNFSHRSPLKEQPPSSVDDAPVEISCNVNTSRATSVVTVRLGPKHCATKRPLNDPTVDGHAAEENEHRSNTKRPLMRPSSIHFSSAAFAGARRKVVALGSMYNSVRDGWKAFLSPSPIVEQKYSSCLKKSSSSNFESSLDASKFRVHAKDKTCLAANENRISENCGSSQCKAITEQLVSGIQMGEYSIPRPNKLPLPGSNLMLTTTEQDHTSTTVPLQSAVTEKNRATMTLQETMSNQSSGMETDLNHLVATATTRPSDLAITLDFDELPHAMTARKSRSLEDILTCPFTSEIKNSSKHGIISDYNKHSSHRINILASPVTLGLDKHLLRCQTTKSDSFKSPSSSESLEMIPVS